MPGSLEHLLRRVLEGVADASEVAEARRLALQDARVPEELGAVVLQDPEEHAADAAGLLAVLGADPLFGEALVEAIAAESGEEAGAVELPEEREVSLQLLSEPDPPSQEQEEAWIPLGNALREGLLAEAQGFDVTVSVEEALDLPRVQVARAVGWESGRVELAEQVLAAVDGPVLPVAAAVNARRGAAPDVSVAVLERLGTRPLPVRQAVQTEAGDAQIAGAVARELGLRDLSGEVRAAVQGEAGPADVLTAVLQAIGGRPPLPVADAVRAEAGTVDIVHRVERTLAPEAMAGVLDHQLDDTTHRLAAQRIREDNLAVDLTSMAELGRELGNALHEEAGRVDLWAEVAHAIGIEDPEHVDGWDGLLLARAVRAEAGAVDPKLLNGVMEGVRRWETGVARGFPAGNGNRGRETHGMPRAEIPIESLPPPANRGTWALGGLLMAALVLMMVGLGWLGGGQEELPAPGIQLTSALTFASADELIVEDLQYGADVQVFQTQGEGGAVIIWVDEEAVL